MKDADKQAFEDTVAAIRDEGRYRVSADIMPELKAHPQTYVTSAPILRVHQVELDMRVPPFDKKLARQAANYAVDKQALIQKIMGGLGTQVATVVQSTAFGFDPEIKPYPYDPKKAKELLAQAGYPNGVDVTLHSGDIAIVKIGDLIGERRERKCIRAEITFRITISRGQRAAASRADQQRLFAVKQHHQREGASQAFEQASEFNSIEGAHAAQQDALRL